MKKTYDLVFVVNLPAFYKINLFNRISENRNIVVIFLASASRIRSDDYYGKKKKFDHHYLYQGLLEERPITRTVFELLKYLIGIKYKRLVVNGWDEPEYWAGVMMSRKSRNGVIVESSGYESKISGIKAYLKRCFLNKIDFAIASGESHLQLIRSLGFKGKSFISGGVGLLNKDKFNRAYRPFRGRYLYVGRLAPEKNVDRLIRVFNLMPDRSLTIAGTGPLENDLKKIAGGNISFIGHIPNHELDKIYDEHDVFILPSIAEPWGLVVEEALFHGLPVIVSRTCGCANPIVEESSAGLLFDPFSTQDLKEKVEEISRPEVFSFTKRMIAEFNFKQRDEGQIRAYLSGLE